MYELNTNQKNSQTSNFEAHQKAYCETLPILFAQPYNLDGRGFYFSTADEYDEKNKNLKDCFGMPIEEFEIMFIDGSREDAQLFTAADINQCNFEQFLALIDELENHEKAALYYLMSSNGYNLSDALSKIDNVSLYNGLLEEAATELFDEIYTHSIPENIRFYIDYEKFTRDCEYGGDMSEFDFGGVTYTCTNASSI
jgi:hypothetical protein